MLAYTQQCENLNLHHIDEEKTDLMRGKTSKGEGVAGFNNVLHLIIRDCRPHGQTNHLLVNRLGQGQ
jgi:hypothetical protein